MGPLRHHPHLYEIGVWPWLDRLSREQGRNVTLGSVPDTEWDRLRDLGFDLVYLMGVWRRSAIGRHIARSEVGLFDRYDGALPGWSPADIQGSPFCVSDYSPDPRVGTWDELDGLRRRLHERGLRLVLDFVPNHTAFDHRWVTEHPDRYLAGSLEAYRRAPAQYRLVEPAAGPPVFLACGRDPYFPPWSDVAQLDYGKPQTRRAMVDALAAIARHCDGVRCDMAMLVLGEVFARTWSGPSNRGEFWAEARSALPDLLLIAEVYWDLEYRLQQLGFSFTYDKRLYDRLLHEPPSAVRDHLRADLGYQTRSARFLENHDEPRSLAAFGTDRLEAAALICGTVPGLRFYYDGQLEGRRRSSPVQVGRWADEPIDEETRSWYARLLRATAHPVFHEGAWTLLEVAPSGWTGHENLIAFCWQTASAYRLVVANPGRAAAEGYVRAGASLGRFPGEDLIFADLLHGHESHLRRETLEREGMLIKLHAGRGHLFELRTPALDFSR